jgi:hypothetical protein
MASSSSLADVIYEEVGKKVHHNLSRGQPIFMDWTIGNWRTIVREIDKALPNPAPGQMAGVWMILVGFAFSMATEDDFQPVGTIQQVAKTCSNIEMFVRSYLQLEQELRRVGWPFPIEEFQWMNGAATVAQTAQQGAKGTVLDAIPITDQPPPTVDTTVVKAVGTKSSASLMKVSEMPPILLELSNGSVLYLGMGTCFSSRDNPTAKKLKPVQDKRVYPDLINLHPDIQSDKGWVQVVLSDRELDLRTMHNQIVRALGVVKFVRFEFDDDEWDKHAYTILIVDIGSNLNQWTPTTKLSYFKTMGCSTPRSP